MQQFAAAGRGGGDGGDGAEGGGLDKGVGDVDLGKDESIWAIRAADGHLQHGMVTPT